MPVPTSLRPSLPEREWSVDLVDPVALADRAAERSDARSSKAADAPAARAADPGLSYPTYLAVSGSRIPIGVGFSRAERVNDSVGVLPHRPAAVPDPHRRGMVRRYSVEVSPGTMRVRATATASEGAAGSPGKRQAITEWSHKSRMNMVETMASLDWSPVVEPDRSGWRPCMVTLTLPGAWEDLAPTKGAYRDMLDRFRKRWERQWGDLAAVWKDEYQRRGAPHTHLYCAAGVGASFREWVALAWTNSIFRTRARRIDGEDWDAFIDRCRESYEARWVDSLLAGTGLDWGEGMRASDPKRLAVYFLKRASGHNVSEGKEYQNRPPEHWTVRLAGPYRNGDELDRLRQSVGRFWGYWHLEPVTADVQLTGGEFVQLRRLMRRWSKANGRPLPWLGRGRMTGGMLLLNDAPGFFRQAAVWLASLRDAGPVVDPATGEVLARPDRWANFDVRLDDVAVAVLDSRYVALADRATERSDARSSKAAGPMDHEVADCGGLCMDHLGVVVVESVSAANGQDLSGSRSILHDDGRLRFPLRWSPLHRRLRPGLG